MHYLDTLKVVFELDKQFIMESILIVYDNKKTSSKALTFGSPVASRPGIGS